MTDARKSSLHHAAAKAFAGAFLFGALASACSDPSAPAASTQTRRVAPERACQATYVPIDVAGAAALSVNGLNNAGDIVGIWTDAQGNDHPFARDARGHIVEFHFPGADFTNPLDINDEGLIVGVYQLTGDPVKHGFTLRHGRFARVDDPNAAPQSRIRGVDDAEELMGNFGDVSTDIEHGWIRGRAGFATIDFPGSSTTDVWDGNGHGQFVGDYTGPDGNVYPYLLNHGRFSTITTPMTFAFGSTARGINAAGIIVGFGTNENGVDYAIGVVHGRGMIFDYPESVYGVDFNRVNDQGVILGAWYDADYNAHNFFARLDCEN